MSLRPGFCARLLFFYGRRLFDGYGSTLNEIHEIRDWAELTFEPEVHSKQIKKEELIAFVSDQGINDRQFRMEW